MGNRKQALSNIIRYILIMTFIIAVNVTLDIVLTIQSGSAMKDLIGSRMLDVTNTAADMIDGDALKSVTPADKGTPEYESVMRILTYFQDNIELKYIYCIREESDGKFVFGLDPTIEDPAEFGAPVIYTDALYAASKGTPSVDANAYDDAWGSFYSAYSPVYASDGSLAGIIAVDLSKEWFDDQMSAQANTVIVVNTLSLLVCSVLVIFMARGARRRRIMSEQLAATADIYISMHEINIVSDTFVEIYNKSAQNIKSIGESKAKASQVLKAMYEKITDPSYTDRMLEFVDLDTLNERLGDSTTIINEYLSMEGKWRRARFIVSERNSSGNVVRVVYLIEDIDAEKRERDMTLEAVKLMNEQISSVANIYFSMHDIDLTNNTLREIKTHVSDISSFFAVNVENAQQLVFEEVDKSVSEISWAAMREFVDFSTIEERFKDANTITEEFLNRYNVWCRARLVISKCGTDGKIEHVLWLIESIDEEKRRRDAISEEARNLNYQISSISNIYMVVYDVDIIKNTFSIIKSEYDVVNNIVGSQRTDTQSAVIRVMTAITDESSMDEMMRFIDLSTLERRLANTNTVTLEFITKTKRWIRVRFLVSRRTNLGRLSHVLWLAEDIDEEKKERDKLIDMSERAIAASEAKSLFLSNMSHEIRTPINAVLGMNEMILRECDDQNILSYSNSIRIAGTTLLGIINDILDFSKIEAGKMEIIPGDYDLSSMINDLVNMIQTRADDRGLKLELNISKKIPKLLRGDEVRIKQVITNLLTNAVKYTEKGTVTFGINCEKIPDDPGSVILDISVSDTGIGIRKEDMHKLFSEFDRIEEDRNRKVEGTGLGISITQRLLQMMNSSLEVESVYGLGSRFSFRLKQTVVKWDEIGDYETAYKEAAESRSKYQEKFRAPSAEVLVIDDTQMNLKVFIKLLKQTEVRIDTAGSGKEGLALAYKKKYDIIFLDHMMPEMDGIETLHALRERTADPNLNTPVICLTANAVAGAREQYLAEGFNGYLTKPIDPEKLEEMLLDYLPEEKIQPAEEETEKKPEPEPVKKPEPKPENEILLRKPAKEKKPADIGGARLPLFLSRTDELDLERGITGNGSVEGYLEALEIYAEMIDGIVAETRRYWQAGDLENTTIKIHAMKSTSRVIGAMEIGALAQELEYAGKDGDAGKLGERIEELFDRCLKLAEVLSPLVEQSEKQ